MTRLPKRSTACVAGLVALFLAMPPLTATAGQDGKAGQVDPAQIARGARAWANTCAGCHNLRGPNELTDEDWDVTVTHMRVRANIPGQVARDIKAFLKASN